MGRRGIALMTALLLAVFVLVLALSLLTFTNQENAFNVTQERTLRAHLCAETALDVYRVMGEKLVPGGPPIRGQVPVPKGVSWEQHWQVLVSPTGDVRATGTLVLGGRILAQRTIVVPQTDFTQRYEIAGP